MKRLSDITDNAIVDAIARWGIYGCDVEDDDSADRLAEDLDVPIKELETLGDRITTLIHAEALYELDSGSFAPSPSSWARILTEWLAEDVPGLPMAERIEDILTGDP